MEAKLDPFDLDAESLLLIVAKVTHRLLVHNLEEVEVESGDLLVTFIHSTPNDEAFGMLGDHDGSLRF